MTSLPCSAWSRLVLESPQFDGPLASSAVGRRWTRMHCLRLRRTIGSSCLACRSVLARSAQVVDFRELPDGDGFD
jgi:hypothetical protein